MTLDEARQLLDAVRAGTSNPPWSRVRLALQMNGRPAQHVGATFA